MSKLLICSEPDPPSVNMRDRLFTKSDWKCIGSDDRSRYYESGDDVIMSTSDIHIFSDDLDKRAEDFGIRVDSVIFMSKHSSASGKPALTVHPIGNYHDNKLGGREEVLVPAMPSLMTDALRRIVSHCDMIDFQTCFEVTHHGPWLDKPTFFIEIGSDESTWGNIHAADILAEVLTDIETNDYPVLVGVAGGHYAPRFTDVATKFKVNFGHMIPNYQIEDRDDDDVLRMIKDATDASGSKLIYIHRNSLKKSTEHHLVESIETAGYEILRSNDLESFNGN